MFLFGGQGALWHAVGREMIEHEPLFRETIAMISNLLKNIGETWSLLDELHACPSNSRLSQASVGQPATFAIQYATAKLLMSWSLVPAAVIGHSLGEYAAACTVGAITVEEALRLVLLRSKLHENCPTNGGMAAIGNLFKVPVVIYHTFSVKPRASSKSHFERISSPRCPEIHKPSISSTFPLQRYFSYKAVNVLMQKYTL